MTKRSLTVAGHRTSISVEEPFWKALGEIAQAQRSSVALLVESIDRQRPPQTNLSAAVRVYVLAWFRRKAAGA